MLIHPWDAARDEAEWRAWLADHEPFGVLCVAHRDPAEAPFALPLHVTMAEGALLAHLARANPVWPHLEAASRVRVAFHGDYAFVPGYWRAAEKTDPTAGVPTSYYAAVQFVCEPFVLDDPAEKAKVLSHQLADLQPEGHHGPVRVGEPPYGAMLGSIRGLRLAVISVEAKFKYDDQKPPALRQRVARELRARAHNLDPAAAAQQERRLAADPKGRA
jgi:transcriptional regulator